MMEAEVNFSQIAPLVFWWRKLPALNSENKDIPEALDLWEAMKKDYEVPPLSKWVILSNQVYVCHN
jgi:hypothetical protein